MKIATHNKDPKPDTEESALNREGCCTWLLPYKDNVGYKEELEQRVPDEADRQYRQQGECRQAHCAPAHPSMTEIMGRGEAVETFVRDQLPSQQPSHTPRDGSTESMDPE